MIRNEHIGRLGFRLEFTSDPEVVRPLLQACDLSPVEEHEDQGDGAPEYLMASTAAGGLAACIGWSRLEETVVVHSLAVAPSTRGRGLGASMVSTGCGMIMDRKPVETLYLIAGGGRSFFRSFGFEDIARERLPPHVARHPAFTEAPTEARPMYRRYLGHQRGLDHCAFRLVHNTTEDATLPPGSVFFFRQSGDIVEASYRGGPVKRGHLMGVIQSGELRFLWHHFLDGGTLTQGEGTIFIKGLEDGRRELREKLTDDPSDYGELLLREV